MIFVYLRFHNVQAVKLAGQLGDYRRSQASSAAEPHLLQQRHSRPSMGLVVPVFTMSSVTGLGLPVLHAFLNALPALPHTAMPLMENPSGHYAVVQHAVPAEHAMRAGHAVPAEHAEHAGMQSVPYVGTATAFQHHANALDANDNRQMDRCVGNEMAHEDHTNPAKPQIAATHFQVDHTFEVKGVGCVVSGTVVSGEVAVGQVLNLGPTGQGLFSKVQVTCIHRSQVQPSTASSCCCVDSNELDVQHGEHTNPPEGLALKLTAVHLL